MTLHRSTVSCVRRSVVTWPVIAGLLVASTQAGAMPAPQPGRSIPVLEAAVSRALGERGNRTLFTWTGRVDREVLIVVRGRDVRTGGFDAALPNRTRVNSALPRTAANVVAQLNDGRGDVDVIEQPSSRNGYQAVLRVRDPRAGADNYRITAYIDERYDNDDVDDRRDDDRGNNGNGGGWGRGGRRDNEPLPGNGRGNGRDKGRDKDDRDKGRDRDKDDRDKGRDRNDRNDRNEGNDRNDGDERDGRYDNRGGTNQNGGAGSLSWSGRVDDVVEIQLSGRRVDAITRSGVRVSDVNSNVRGGGLPNRNVNLRIDQRSGRGSITVIQQPSSWNGYTAIIRINDSRSGAAFYDFAAYWE